MIESPLLSNPAGYIGGQWTPSDSGERFEVITPATGEKLADVPAMGREETLRAVRAGEKALAEPVSIEQRREWLQGIERALLDNEQEIARILTAEQGKPLKEAAGEVRYAAGFFRNAATHIDELRPYTLEDRPKDRTWTVHARPAGVVGLITPWNFPIGMIAKKLSSAIAADAPSVLKPAEQTPLTMIALFHLLHGTVGLPAGKVNLVMGHPEPIGDALCEHPKVRVLSLTGSTEVGKLLIRKTADQVKKLCLELGGNAPFVVFEDADLDAAADELIANKFRAGGQTCVCANRIYVQDSVADAFTEKVVQRVGELTVGNGAEEGTDIGPLIDRQGFNKVRRHIADALDKGAERVAGEDPPQPDGEWGCFHPPTVLTDVTHEMICCQEETFGPVVPILRFGEEQEAVDAANDTHAGLAAYIFTGDDARAERVIAQLSFGHVGWNTGAGPTPEAPFGGMKQSGYGREGGVEGIHEFVELQAVPKR
jgi:succinate-semialdehyde dehydrogenase/glutarate-semialdehyde dehydrogenase